MTTNIKNHRFKQHQFIQQDSKKYKSIVLVEPTRGLSGLSTFAGHNEFEPLGLEYIAAFLTQKGYSTHVLRQMDQSIETITQKILSFNPDVVGFSVLTYNVNAARKITDRIKRLNPRVIIIYGGYHPSGEPEIVSEDKNIDFVIIGEGEFVFYDLLLALEHNKNPIEVKGIAFWDDAFIKTEPANRIQSLDVLPFPSRDEEILKDCKIYGLMYPPPTKQHNVAMVLGSRGCPFNCSFCCTNLLWGQTVRYRTPMSIVDEIQELQKRYQTNAIFFPDLTFNLNKDWVLALCEEMMKLNRKIHWYAMCSLKGIDSELIEAMAQAGCRKIGFGIESFNITTLERVKPTSLHSLNETNNIFEICSREGIFTKAYFMMGFPWENHQSIEAFEQDVLNLNVDEIKIAFFTPFPGTQAFEECKDLLWTRDYDYYDTLDTVVVRNENLSQEEFKAARRRIFRNFYNSNQYKERAQMKTKLFPIFLQSYKEFFELLIQRHIASCLPDFISIPEKTPSKSMIW